MLQYANDKRNNGSFNDVTIEAGDQTISANHMILSCCSRFFEAMFDLELKEKYQNPVQIHGVDGAAVKSVIDFSLCQSKTLPKNDLVSLISKINRKQTNEKSIFNGIVTWCRYDEEARKEEFPMLYENLINLDLISDFVCLYLTLRFKSVSDSLTSNSFVF